jgi:two-component system response regulator YesN
MNLMIVEDEIRLRSNLANNIPWDSYGIEVVGLAANGKKAMELVDLKKPDIVLLDIQMPEMDGITFARLVHEQAPDIQFIILSGHDNFSYAQSALEIGIFKYLLKPAGEEVIVETVLDAAKLLRQKMDQRMNAALLQQKWQDHLPHLQEAFLQNWISGKYVSWEIVQKSNELQIDLSQEQRYAIVLLDMDPLLEAETRFDTNDVMLLQFSSKSITREFLSTTPLTWVFTDAQGYTVILFASSKDTSSQEFLLRINTTISKLLSTIKNCLKLTASAGISGSSGIMEELVKLYKQALSALQERMVYGHDIAIPYQEKYGIKETVSIEPYLEKALGIALETANLDKALNILNELWNNGIECAGTLEEVNEYVLYLSSFFVQVIQKQGWSVIEVMGKDYSYFQNPQALTTKKQTYQWLSRIIRNYIEYLQNQRKNISHEVVKVILDIIEKEIDQELTLHTVADKLYINSSYLSRLFKQETGKPFSNYVLERKMDRAKSALIEGAKVYDAANMVGFKDPSYFTKVFRKYWGITPGEIMR